MTVEQILVPQQRRQQVMHIAHTIPLAGYLGRNKTARRLVQRFYWPTLFREVANYCWLCHECQKSSGERERWAPMIPHPVMGIPFERIAMDIMGPLPRSWEGHRYILVVCDYTTRFPKAFPLTRIDGTPDCRGTNFTSGLLTEIYRLLHVHPIRTSPYHPQTDGLVERINKTLKVLLRKTSVWDWKGLE